MLHGLWAGQMEALMAVLELAKQKGHDVDSLQDALLAFMLRQHSQAQASVKIEEIESDEEEAIKLQDLNELHQQEEEEEAQKKQEEEEAQKKE